ncbi:MAG: lytic murein transglycosylase B [Gammaproteobacteria bacterium]|nr:lytic murein transglycosylase [Gammaproteobacteria bacterium]MYC25638.1 lytic murein transglycosylase B [Gammaproteobacteria bacterium]
MNRIFALSTTLVLISWFPLVADYSGHEKVGALVDELVSEYSFDRATLMSVFKEIKHKPDIIEIMDRPAETKPWFQYRNIFIQRKRVNDGVKFIRNHRDDLDRAFDEYEVPAHIIAAVIGIETNYGGNMGSYRVMDALATLGLDYPRREKLFRRELKQFFVLACEERIKPFDADDACDRKLNNLSSGQGRSIEDLIGSYAGAMGYGQFIPSSYRHFAIDFDKDGMRDIWSNISDAIGSVANYFAEHNWTKDGLIMESVEIDTSQGSPAVHANLTLEEFSTTVEEWQALGIKSSAPSTQKAALFAYKLDDKESPTLQYMLGFENFYSITRYNPSRLYARAVFELATEIQKKM